MPSRVPLRLRLNTSAPPSTAGDGRPAEFGLQDRAERLVAGLPGPEGRLTFALDLEVSQDPASGRVRFHSPFVHGPAAARFLYLSWRNCDGQREWVRRQKLPLASLTWERVQAAPGTPASFAAEVPAITERCATIPIEWVPVQG